MKVVLNKASKSDMAIVENLVPYYIYDMSEYLGWPCSAAGKFGGCDMLETYWEEKGKHPFLLNFGDEIVGFALIRGNHEEKEIDFSVGEFFVLRKFRGKRVGETIATEIFDLFRGNWQVEQLQENLPAVGFWRKVIGRYTNYHFEESIKESDWGPKNDIRFSSMARAV